MKFEWDTAKAAANQAKHGVLFEEAQSVFNDSLAVIFDDVEHSQSEPRELILGHSQQNRLLIVSFTERDGTIRIISARLATRNERNDYEQNALS